jgi:protease II
MAIVLEDSSRFFVLLKDLQANSILDVVLYDISEEFGFTENGSLYYIRASQRELERRNCLCFRNRNNINEELVVYEEPDPNIQISSNFCFLILYKI